MSSTPVSSINKVSVRASSIFDALTDDSPHRMLVLSPHLDDAVLACGRLLASLPGAVVITVFAGRPSAEAPLTEWDRTSGFWSGSDAVSMRRYEDRSALNLLGSHPLWLNFQDSQYGESPSPESLLQELEPLLQARAPRVVLMPMGLFHSDHHLTHQVALALLERHPDITWLAYEDALYRRFPGQLDERISALEDLGLRLRREAFQGSSDALSMKQRAVACYRSQCRALTSGGRPGLDDAWAPEGYWQLMDA